MKSGFRGNKDLSCQVEEQINKLMGLGDASGTKKRAMHIRRYDPSIEKTNVFVI